MRWPIFDVSHHRDDVVVPDVGVLLVDLLEDLLRPGVCVVRQTSLHGDLFPDRLDEQWLTH
jgi:hypothetical protein